MSYLEQAKRIIAKLKMVKEKDKKLLVFGASYHKYYVDKPISEHEIIRFEEKYKTVLPDDYRVFMTVVGNGGVSDRGAAAGPFYGIYRFGKELDDIIIDPQTYLKYSSRLSPTTTDDEWATMTNAIESDGIELSEFDEQQNVLFQGLLPIGSQGCAYVSALVVSGQNHGRIVNIDIDRQKPTFAHANNFMDWYEQWLDEILSGKLLQEGPSWFGYS